MTPLPERLKAAGQAHSKARRTEAAALDQARQAIRDAIAAGLTIDGSARIIGLTFPTVYKIIGTPDAPPRQRHRIRSHDRSSPYRASKPRIEFAAGVSDDERARAEAALCQLQTVGDKLGRARARRNETHQQLDALIAEAKKDHMGTREIARTTGMNPNNVQYYARRGSPVRRRGRPQQSSRERTL